MEAIEIKQQLDRISNEVKEEGVKAKQEIAEAVKDKASASDVEAIKEAFETRCAEAEKRMDELKEAAEKQGMELKGYMEKGQAAHKSFGENLNDSITAQAEALKSLYSGSFQGKINMTVKAAGTMTTANILPSVSTAIPYSMTDFEGGITRIARRKPFLREVLNARPVSGMYVAWAEQVNVDGAAGTVAEGAAKPQIDFDIQERTAKVEKVAGWAKTSKEALADVQGMRNFIEDEIRQLVELKFDEQLYSGNGTTPNLKGLYTWASTASVAGTPFALGVNLASNWDVLAAITAVMANNHFTADTYILNPMDYAMMSMIKTTDGIYIQHPLATAGGQMAAGIRVVTNSFVTAGTFVVLDSTKVNLGIREEFNIQVGYENDDFTKNLVTILGEMRGILYVKTNYANAVVKGTFATVAAAMETA